VTEIDWSDNAFESLVLPKEHKELILAFAEGQLRCKETFDDVIQGKGEQNSQPTSNMGHRPRWF